MLSKIIVRSADLIKRHPKGWINSLVNQAAAMARSTYVPMLPVHITIEPTDICDQRCPVCETGAGILRRPKGMMSLENFRTVVDKIAPHANTLLFYFMGEPFLVKNSYEMIRYARDKGIFVDACTNGHFIDPEKLVWSGINQVSFQLGGITQETHEIYRVRGDLAKALGNARAVVAEKKKRGLDIPRVILGFIVMKHNEHEVEQFYKLAEEMGVDEAQVIGPAVRSVEQGKQFLTKDEQYWYYDRDAFERGVLRPKTVPNNRCYWIWHSTVITWDGDIVPCCRDPQGDFVMGNILQEDLARIWNNQKFRDFRRRILTDQRNVSICRLCSSYSPPVLY